MPQAVGNTITLPRSQKLQDDTIKYSMSVIAETININKNQILKSPDDMAKHLKECRLTLNESIGLKLSPVGNWAFA